MTSNTYRGRKHPSPGVLLNSHQDCTVFLTVVTLHRRCWLASPTTQKLLHQTWEETTHWLVGTYLLMPDHLHMFCAPRKHNGDIETWIRYWKRLFRQIHQREDWNFQAHGWHHRMRHDESREDKWRYITENPVRKGLTSNPSNWPYQGIVYQI